MRLDRLLRAVPARGEAVGDREQRDVDLHGLAGTQVGEHACGAQRLGLVHEKAQPQVVAHERRYMRPQAPARRAACRAPHPPAAHPGRRAR